MTFVWHGRKDATASNYLVSWPKVCRPIEFCGLAIRDLRHRSGIALRTRWQWPQATTRLGLGATYNSPLNLRSGNSSMLHHLDFRGWPIVSLWMDHWLEGRSITELAPTLTSLVPLRRRHTRLVCDAFGHLT